MLRRLCFETAACGCHDVEAVTRARVHVELGRHARLVQPQRVVDVFVAESVGRADRHERGRQSREVGGARGRRGRRHVVGAVQIAEVRLPSERVGVAAPHREPVLPARRRDLAVVEHGLVEELERHRHLAAVAREQAQRGGETSARAHAHHADAVRVDAQLVRVLVASTAIRGSSLRADPGYGVSGARRYSTDTPTRPSFGHSSSRIGSSIRFVPIT